MDILSTFYGVCMIPCATLMLRIFEFGVFFIVYITCLKIFTRYGHYAGDVEGIIVGRLAVVS